MAARSGSTRSGKGRGGSSRYIEGTTSGYGTSRADSVGYSPRNPSSMSATQAAKAYPKSTKFDAKATAGKFLNIDSDG